MAFSYTEKKRIRRSFEKISSVMDLPNLLTTQLESYNDFLQRNVDPKKRKNQGLEKLKIRFSCRRHETFVQKPSIGFPLPCFGRKEPQT